MPGHRRGCPFVWRPLVEILFSCPSLKSSHCNSFEDRATVALIHGCPKLKHDDVIKWEHFPCYWLSVRGIHRSPVDSPHKGQWRGALMFSLICAKTNGWANNRGADDLRRHLAHHDVTVMRSCRNLLTWQDQLQQWLTSNMGPIGQANCDGFIVGRHQRTLSINYAQWSVSIPKNIIRSNI